MCRDNLDDLPPIEIPDKFSIRHFHDGDEAAWEKIIEKSFGRNFEIGQFNRDMKSDPAFQPQRVLFVTHNDKPIATASAWFKPDYGQESGYVHMVGVLPEYQGNQLGYWISLAVLHRLAKEGRKKVYLQTDDFRLAAVKTYLKLGFRPVMIDENMPERYRAIFEKLGIENK